MSFIISIKVFLHPNSAPLWREYLLFTQSYFSNFTVTKVNAAYGKCLSTLSAVRDGSMLSHPARPGTEEDMLGTKPIFFALLFTYSAVNHNHCFQLFTLANYNGPMDSDFNCWGSYSLLGFLAGFFQTFSPCNVISCDRVVTLRRHCLCSRPWSTLHSSNLTVYESCPPSSR